MWNWEGEKLDRYESDSIVPELYLKFKNEIYKNI